MKVKDYIQFKVLLDLIQQLDSRFLISLVFKLINGLNDGILNDIELLKLFEYSIIRDEYHLMKDIINVLCLAYDINKYSDIINPIRINNGLGYDRDYLNKLLSDLKIKANKHGLFKNSRFIGLYNLLSDNNLIYNNVGLRINIVRYLIDIDIKALNVFILSNDRLNDEYKHLVFKNDKIKFYSKLYFINDNIVLSTLQHDNIINVVYTMSDNPNIFYGGLNEAIQSDNSPNDIKSNRYTFFDKEYQFIEYITDLLNVLCLFHKINYTHFNHSDINDKNIDYFLILLKNNSNVFYRYDKLMYKFNYILNYIKNDNTFKSNDLRVNDYCTMFDEFIHYNSKEPIIFKCNKKAKSPIVEYHNINKPIYVKKNTEPTIKKSYNDKPLKRLNGISVNQWNKAVQSLKVMRKHKIVTNFNISYYFIYYGFSKIEASNMAKALYNCNHGLSFDDIALDKALRCLKLNYSNIKG